MDDDLHWRKGRGRPGHPAGWARWLPLCIVALTLLCSPAQSEREPRWQEVSGTAAVQPQPPQDAVPDTRTPEQRMADNRAKLLKLAGELRKEVEKTGVNTLSLTVVRKADEIEKLAHSMRLEMNRKPGS